MRLRCTCHYTGENLNLRITNNGTLDYCQISAEVVEEVELELETTFGNDWVSLYGQVYGFRQGPHTVNRYVCVGITRVSSDKGKIMSVVVVSPSDNLIYPNLILSCMLL